MIGYEVDALFADQRVIVELDSWGFHAHREPSSTTATATPTCSRPAT